MARARAHHLYVLHDTDRVHHLGLELLTREEVMMNYSSSALISCCIEQVKLQPGQEGEGELLVTGLGLI